LLELDANFFGDEMKDEFLEQLNAYADGELTEEERRRVEEHLASCAPCRAAYEEILELKALMKEAEIPQGLSASWRMEEARTRQKKARGRRMVRRMASLVALACVGILCFRAMPWWKGDPQAADPAPLSVAAQEEAGQGLKDSANPSARQEMFQDGAISENELSEARKQEAPALAMAKADALALMADLVLAETAREEGTLYFSFSQEEGERVLAWLHDHGYHLECQGALQSLFIILK
jgi:hypothetical protein